MKLHSQFLRALLLSAVGVAFSACGGEADTCETCDGTGGPDGGDSCASCVPTDEDCTNPVAVPDRPGFFSCDEGYIHRAESALCPNLLPRDEEIELPGGSGDAGGAGGAAALVDECTRDSDCGELEYCALVLTNPPPGICALPPYPEPGPPVYDRVCRPAGSGCATDADCASDHYCSCGTLAGDCVPVGPTAGCRTSADCTDDALCLVETHWYGGGGLACALPGDECQSDADCPASGSCVLSADTGRACVGPVTCGRPYLVRGSARLAQVEVGSGWSAALDAVVLPDDGELRLALSSHFARIGAMEHASVAAFARFTLQLLSLGAPAWFIEASNAALVDETRHARVSFGLASAYAGRELGPGALPLEGALDGMTLEAIFEATVLEGCVGETRAALEARWTAERTRDPVVRRVLQQIADEESRHAELAWRVATWLVTEHPHLQTVLSAALARAAEQVFEEDGRPEDAAAWGILPSNDVRACSAEAWKAVVMPCASALLGRAGASGRRNSMHAGEEFLVG